MHKVNKDPQAVLSYGWDWSNFGTNDGSSTDTGWLQGDTIAVSSWSIDGPDTALTVDSSDNSSTETSVVLSGGTLGRTYSATNHIATAAGFEDDRTITVTVAQK